MTQLPEPNFIERDADKITQEWIDLYESKSGKVLQPAQIERLMIDSCAYRENLLRIKIQELIPNTKETDILFKPVIRSSNSVYYPNILSSIFIPANDELNEYSINLIREEHEDGSNAQTISKNLKRYKNIEIDSTIIQKLINNNFSERELEIAKTENQYRFDEYKFITEKDNERVEDKIIFNKIRL